MRTIDRILVPTDFSTHADAALDHGLGLARQHSAELYVLHVISPAEGGHYSPLRYSPENAILKETTDVILHRMMKQLLEAHDTDDVTMITEEVHSASVAPRILAFARQYRMDQIVMGTHGRRGIRHALLGSVTEAVVRQSPCPVVAVRKEACARQTPPRRILAAIDFSEQGAAVLRRALGAAHTAGATLDVLHVIEPLAFPISLTGIATIYDLIPDIENKVRVHMKRLLSRVGRDGVPVDLLVADGPPVGVICGAAEARGHDLIVMGTHGYSGLRSLFIGSVAERVIRQAPCPVLIVPPATPPATADVEEPAATIAAPARPEVITS